jgi:autotransporter-associated beta strand protein
LTKSGAGKLTLSGPNSHTGATRVTGGQLQVGSAGIGQTGSGAVTVESASTILGTGTVRGTSFTLNSGTTLHAGDGTTSSSLGTLTFTPAASGGTLSLQGSIILDVSTPTTTDATLGGENLIGSVGYNNWLDGISGFGGHDRLVFNNPAGGGSSTLSFLTTTGILQVRSHAFTPAYGQVFNLLDWGDLVSKTFSGFSFTSGYVTGNGDEGTELDLPFLPSGLLWDTTRLTTSGNVGIIPEPSRALLVCLGLLGLLRRRRRE